MSSIRAEKINDGGSRPPASFYAVFGREPVPHPTKSAVEILITALPWRSSEKRVSMA